MADIDKPLGNIKRISLDQETNPEPARYPLKSGRLVTFPDIFDFPTEKAEDFLDELNVSQQSGHVSSFLKKWLTEADYKALTAEYDTMRKIRPVVMAVTHHYEGVWGSEEKDAASED